MEVRIRTRVFSVEHVSHVTSSSGSIVGDGQLGMCNICTPALANSSLGRHCTPEIYGKYVCAGFLEDKHLVGHEAVASAHPSKCNSSAAEWQCWRNHLVSKVGGQWWSFFNESYCGGDMG